MNKKDEDKKSIEVVFAPGCFDKFDGTQEELDELIQQIKEMALTGELLNQSEDIQDLIDDTDPMEIEKIVNEMFTPRILH
jgi:hypothetical protein